MKKIHKSLGFPTLGEVLHFAFDAAGVLPRKRRDLDGFDEKTKKSIQKALSRLESEEGELSGQFGEMIRTLGYIVAGVNSSDKVNAAIGEIVFDVFDVYNQVLRTDGSYRDKPETMRWFLSSYVINRLVLSVNKHLLRLNVADVELIVPDDPFWFLPSIDNGIITWPLEKTMRWAYSVCDTLQTHFHYPGKKVGSDSFEQQQNLDNATNWIKGKSLPSWGALQWNLNHSFEQMNLCGDTKHNRVLTEEMKESIRLALFVARACTFIAKEIHGQYGEAYLADACNQYQRYSGYIMENVSEIKDIVSDFICKNANPPNQIDAVWQDLVSEYWAMLADRSKDCSSTIERILVSGETTVPEPTVKLLVERYGAIAVFPILDWMEMQGVQKIPAEFAGQLLIGLNLKACPTTKEQDIERYEQELNVSGVRDLLPWMAPWLRALRFYRQGEYEASFGLFQAAFNLGKYCAGGNQYELVNQYVEVSAKTNRWREFRKGVEWAQYLGLEIRWLRATEPTKENLRGVFNLMKKVQY